MKQRLVVIPKEISGFSVYFTNFLIYNLYVSISLPKDESLLILGNDLSSLLVTSSNSY